MLERLSRRLALLLLALVPGSAAAYEVNLQTGIFDAREIHLRVGVGSWNGNNYLDGYSCSWLLIYLACTAGGAPQVNPTVNVVTATLNQSHLGPGPLPAVPMTANTSAASLRSNLDGRLFCQNGQVYIGGYSRRLGSGANGPQLSVHVASNLSSGTHSIPISEISWTTSGIGDAGQRIPGGVMALGTRQLATFPNNAWVESCMSFTYANTQVRPAGTYTATATYTLSQP